MLRSTKDLMDYTPHTKDDEELGKIDDALFDRKWTLRYLLVNTRKWLPGRRVLVSPFSVQEADGVRMRLELDLTREQVKKSPAYDEKVPLTRQFEENLARHYAWPVYWSGLGVPVTGAAALPARTEAGAQREDVAVAETSGEPRLESIETVTGTHVEAEDGEIGHIETLICEDDMWRIRYAVVDTRNLLPGKKVLISTDWIQELDGKRGKVRVDATRKQIENSPEYDPAKPVNREYEAVLYDYYGRPHYWTS